MIDQLRELLMLDWMAFFLAALLIVLVIALCWIIQRRYENEEDEEFERWFSQRYPDHRRKP